MRFMLEYPGAHTTYSEEFLDPDVMSAVAVTAEKAGFSAIGFTDHPAPSDKWMPVPAMDTNIICRAKSQARCPIFW